MNASPDDRIADEHVAAELSAGSSPRLVLASASPRRLELLARVDLAPLVVPAEIDETPRTDETPSDYVTRMAIDKALVVALEHPDAIVLGADTTVSLGGQILGKPNNADHARSMLRQLSGHTHHVLTAVSVIAPGCETTSLVATAQVSFAVLADDELDWYVNTGEPLGKAGSYAIQGIGEFLVESIDGAPSTVIGLPLRETTRALRFAGIRVAGMIE